MSETDEQPAPHCALCRDKGRTQLFIPRIPGYSLHDLWQACECPAGILNGENPLLEEIFKAVEKYR